MVHELDNSLFNWLLRTPLPVETIRVSYSKNDCCAQKAVDPLYNIAAYI